MPIIWHICVQVYSLEQFKIARQNGERTYPTIEVIRAYIKQTFHPDADCLSDFYINAYEKLIFKCQFNHVWQATWTNLLTHDRWCPECNGGVRYSFDKVNKFVVKKYNGKCLSDVYVNEDTIMSWQCKDGHVFQNTWRMIQTGVWCPHRSKLKSEQTCRYIFETLFENKFVKIRPSYLQKDLTDKRTRYELDGYCAELNLAWEYQGRQHYQMVKEFFDTNDDLAKRQERDQFKRNRCKEIGLFLIEVPFFTRKFKPIHLKDFIKNKCLEMGFPLPPNYDNIIVDLSKI